MALTTEEMALELYKAYLDDLGRMGGRHEVARAFYLSVISALFVFLSLSGTTGPLVAVSAGVQIVVCLVGILISLVWFLHMCSFGTLFRAKKHMLVQAETEAKFPIKPFTEEAVFLQSNKRLRLTVIDRLVSVAFAVLFAALAVLKAA